MFRNSLILFLSLFFSLSVSLIAQTDTIKKESDVLPPKPKKWYENLSLRGYAQLRYNRLLETNPNLKCDQCDKSIGEGGGFFFRRARLVFSGAVHERLSIYIQMDVATAASPGGSFTSQHYVQMRDLYGDVYLNTSKSLRIRLGLSKVPFGFDNLQSSQNRIAFDRSDPINSAAYNERDLGAYIYWSPEAIQKRFKKIMDQKLKGTGDYGMVGYGVFSGQTASRNEINNSLHSVARIAFPFELKNGQFLEAGIQAFSGYFSPKEIVSPMVKAPANLLDRRIGGTMVIYPQPFGLQAEYNFGDGPEFNLSDTSIHRKNLKGGYIQAMYMKKVGSHLITPYYRYQYYSGGKKIESDSRSHKVEEHEIGIEWLPFANLELTVAYMISDRRTSDFTKPASTGNYHEKGNFLRLQLQFNY